MNILEQYNLALDRRAAEEREKAMLAKARDDEREHSMHLMQSSMLGDMLKVLGRVQHEGTRPDALERQIVALEKEAEKQQAQGDYDSADRTRIKAQTIAWAQNVLRELENSHE